MNCGSCGAKLSRFEVGVCHLCRCTEYGVEPRERAARLCEARAESLAANGQPIAANEAMKCAAAIRAMEDAA